MKEQEIATPEGIRDLKHMGHALRVLKDARSQMATTRRPVVLFDKTTNKKLEVAPPDLKLLKFVAFHAYLGARSAGLGDEAETVIADIK